MHKQDNTVSLPQVDNHKVRWFSNQVWQWQPHLHFFQNCLHEHIAKAMKKSHQHKNADAIRVNKALYHKLLLDGQEVTVNGCKFKLEI